MPSTGERIPPARLRAYAEARRVGMSQSAAARVARISRGTAVALDRWQAARVRELHEARLEERRLEGAAGVSDDA